ncbi:serine proteinase inhibitor IA-1 [Lactarius quietus]|nr:serine proteinase inhibitor IA-1 [Lactarius quietus]
MSRKYIVVFKSGASPEVIDEQAKRVDDNGGNVERRFNSVVMKGFTAEIPDTYLVTLQSSLTGGDNEIAYIEPDSVVTTQ